MVKGKRAAMEMTVGTIVTIVLLMSALVLGLILTNTIFRNTTESVNSIDDQMRSEINDLFEQSESETLVIGLGGETTATIKQGTEDFGIPFGFSPERPAVWDTSYKCKWSVEAEKSPSSKSCTKNGWTNPEEDVYPGVADQNFQKIVDNNGYGVIFISVPKSVSPCIQTFRLTVKCAQGTSYAESTTNSFFIKVIRRGL